APSRCPQIGRKAERVNGASREERTLRLFNSMKERQLPLRRWRTREGACGVLCLLFGLAFGFASQVRAEGFQVRVAWGHQSKEAKRFYLRLLTQELQVTGMAGVGLEPGDELRDGECRSQAGAGDWDGLQFEVNCPAREVAAITNVHKIWRHLLASSDDAS